MQNYVYFIQTYYQLPNAKFLMENLNAFVFILKKMMDKKPRYMAVTDLENSIAVHEIDTALVPNYKEIFKEMRFWHWDTVYVPRPRRKYINEDGTLMSHEQVQKLVADKREKSLERFNNQ